MNRWNESAIGVVACPDLPQCRLAILDQLIASVGHARDGCRTVLLRLLEYGQGGLVGGLSLLFQVAAAWRFVRPDEPHGRIEKVASGIACVAEAVAGSGRAPPVRSCRAGRPFRLIRRWPTPSHIVVRDESIIPNAIEIRVCPFEYALCDVGRFPIAEARFSACWFTMFVNAEGWTPNPPQPQPRPHWALAGVVPERSAIAPTASREHPKKSPAITHYD